MALVPRRTIMIRAVTFEQAGGRQLIDPKNPGLPGGCGSWAGCSVPERQSHFSTFTTRARISPAMTSAMADCSIIVIFAHLLVGSVSVGLNAVALVNAR